jgi:hypothetical protein
MIESGRRRGELILTTAIGALKGKGDERVHSLYARPSGDDACRVLGPCCGFSLARNSGMVSRGIAD